MAGKIKFECLKCGECCRNLHIKVEKIGTIGLFLLPNELGLFPAETVVPLYGAGLKGKSRPRPEVIYAYQILQNVCPHLTEENLCDVYDRRPLACRAFPLEIALLNTQCTWVNQHFKENNSTPRSQLDLGDIPKYHDMLFKHIGSYAKRYFYMWAWNLKTRKWVKTH